MFASIVTEDRCQLYTVIRTSLSTYDRQVLTYPPSDYMTAVKRAEWYQEMFDPSREHYDWRVHMCG